MKSLHSCASKQDHALLLHHHLASTYMILLFQIYSLSLSFNRYARLSTHLSSCCMNHEPIYVNIFVGKLTLFDTQFHRLISCRD